MKRKLTNEGAANEAATTKTAANKVATIKTAATKAATIEASISTALLENYRFNLSDFALFMAVMKVREAYEDVLSIILDEPDLKLKEVKAEQVILNKSGKRAIRLDAWALDIINRQFDMEMQNDTEGDDVRRRSRFYQSMIDTPILKSGKETRYKNLPSTVIIFITQEDIFGKNLARYTFTEQCEEVDNLPLEDGTTKIFLNMSSLNGRPELISLLQYMKNTTLDNPDITVRDERIVDLDRIVGEVKQSEEWEAVKMNILEIGIEKGREEGRQEGREEGRQEGREEGRQEGREEGRQEGREEGRQEGREEGETKKQTEIIRNMLKNGLTCQKVSDLTGIPLDIVKEVKRSVY